MIHPKGQINRMTERNFERVFRNLQPRLYAYCRKYIDDIEQAKDIVQECFINLWNHQVDITVSYDSYLFTAVHHRCMSHFRSLKVHADYEISVKQKLKEIEIPLEVPYPLMELYLKDINELLQHCIEKLPEKCRKVFMMSRFQDMKNQEIADELGVSIRTVEAQIYQALKILKEELKDYLPLILLLFLD